MMELLKPLRSVSLKDVFVERLEDLILSGKLPIGAKLPPERALAAKLGVSRPVVHAGLLELAATGLVSIRPRVGAVVNDYRRDGSLALIRSLISHAQGEFDPSLLAGLLSLRRLMQTEVARLAAAHRSDDDLAELRDVVEREALADADDIDAVVDLDFAFHHVLALASGNPIYPMLVKSFEPADKNLASRFFADSALVPGVFDRHADITTAVADRDGRRAVALMADLLDEGSDRLSAMEA
jgi:GntR family transcriptional repressor for pyruvate dehydrogenase complex